MSPYTSSTINSDLKKRMEEEEIVKQKQKRREIQSRQEQISATPVRDETPLGRWQRQRNAQTQEQNKQEDAFKSGVAQILPYFIPGVGQYLMGKDISNAMYEGNKVTIWPETKVSSAGLMLAGLAAPFTFKGVRKLFPKTKQIFSNNVDKWYDSKRQFSTSSDLDASYPSIQWDALTNIRFSKLPDELYTPEFINQRYFTDAINWDDAQQLLVDKLNNKFKSNTNIKQFFDEDGIPDENEMLKIYNRLTDSDKIKFDNYVCQFLGYVDGKLIPFSAQRKAYERGIKFAADYFHSPGYAERFNNSKLKYGNYPITKYIFPESNKITWIEGKPNANSDLELGLFDSDRFRFKLGSTGTHEAFHWSPTYNTRSKVSGSVVNPESPYYNNDYRNIPKEIKDILKPSQEALNRRNSQGLGDLKHDSELSEQYSDLGALRYNLNKEKIFDSRKIGEQFDQKMLDMFRGTKSAKTDRFLDLHTDDQIIKAVNEIAANNNSNVNNYV